MLLRPATLVVVFPLLLGLVTPEIYLQGKCPLVPRFKDFDIVRVREPAQIRIPSLGRGLQTKGTISCRFRWAEIRSESSEGAGFWSPPEFAEGGNSRVSAQNVYDAFKRLYVNHECAHILFYE